MKLKTWIVASVLFFGNIFFSEAQQPKISILGDSYSTFIKYLSPETNSSWYGNANVGMNAQKNDVFRVEETWWYQLIERLDGKLERNNSYSGSTICHSGYDGRDFSDRSYVSRIYNLGNPDIIIVFGGTNDAWSGAPIGEYQYDKWTKQDLFKFRPAFSYMLHHLKKLYPNVKIYNVSNCDISKDVRYSMDKICEHYHIVNIQLEKIDKQAGHPSVKGMKMICDQILKKIEQKEK